MNISKEQTIGEIVAYDYKTSSVFDKFGIDFCCKGNISIEEVCQMKNLDTGILINELNDILSKDETVSTDFNSWPIGLLADYIQKKHHAYVEKNIPIIKSYLAKICQVHGEASPELFEINKLFEESANELVVHMKKEEFILFPYIRKMEISNNNNQELLPPPFGTILNPIEMMMHDHDTEGERFRKISELSHNYNLIKFSIKSKLNFIFKWIREK